MNYEKGYNEMKRTLALVLSILMIVSCFSVFASAETGVATTAIDKTENTTGAVVKKQLSDMHAIGVTGISDGSEWERCVPENVWINDNSVEELKKSNISNGYYPTIKVSRANGESDELQVYGSRARFASPTRLASLDFLFETASQSNEPYTNNAKIYVSVDGEIWEELYTFSSVEPNTHIPYVVENNSTFYNYIALYTEVSNAALCSLMMIYIQGYTEVEALSVDVVRSYGQISRWENNSALTGHIRDFSTQEAIWENNSEVQYYGQIDGSGDHDFDTPHTLVLTDGTEAKGYGAAAKLKTASNIKYFTIYRKGSHKTARSWGQYWDGMTLYGSKDGGNTWTVIAKPTKVSHTWYLSSHSFEVLDEYEEDVFTDVALLTTKVFRIQQVVAYGTPTIASGDAITDLKTVDDGTKWISINENRSLYRNSSDMWENHILFQWKGDNTHSLGSMGLGATAKLEYPTKLTGLKLTFDMTSGKEVWKERANYLSVYASVDGNEWVKLHTVSGCGSNTVDSAYVINVDDDTAYSYIAIYTSDATKGIRLNDVTAYGVTNMTLRVYQTKYYTDDKGVDRCAVRFVATVDESALTNKMLGFDVVARYVKNGENGSQRFNITTRNVYQSILANGKTLTSDDIAKNSGHEYIALCTILDINRANYEYVSFEVTPYEVTAEDKTVTSVPMEVTHATGRPYDDWTINGNSIKDYTIVYQEDGIMKSTVEKFRDKLSVLSGYTLPIKSAEASATALEILIGETGRSATHSVERPKALNYTVATNGNKLVIRTGGEHSLELLMEDFFDVVKCGTNEALSMSLGYSISGNYYDDPYQNTAKVSEADIRAMSANVLARNDLYDYAAYPELDPSKGGTFTFERRVEIFMAALDYYNPDVVGVQEFCYHWVDAVNEYINASDNDHYANWEIKVFDTWNTEKLEDWRNEYSGIIYRKDVLTLTDSGRIRYTNINNNRGQCIAWADFTVNNTGKSFTFVSTHWGAEKYVKSQAEELAAFVNNKKAAGATTVITTGDFNQNENSSIYKGFLSSSGSVDAMTTASNMINIVGSFHEWAGMDNSWRSIDHVTATSNCSVLSYETACYNQQRYGSDHAWLVTDIKIGG